MLDFFLDLFFFSVRYHFSSLFFTQQIQIINQLSFNNFTIELTSYGFERIELTFYTCIGRFHLILPSLPALSILMPESHIHQWQFVQMTNIMQSFSGLSCVLRAVMTAQIQKHKECLTPLRLQTPQVFSK